MYSGGRYLVPVNVCCGFWIIQAQISGFMTVEFLSKYIPVSLLQFYDLNANSSFDHMTSCFILCLQVLVAIPGCGCLFQGKSEFFLKTLHICKRHDIATIFDILKQFSSHKKRNFTLKFEVQLCCMLKVLSRIWVKFTYFISDM